MPDLTASPGRAPPGPMPSHQGMQQQQQHHQQGGHMQQGGQRGGGGSGMGGGANKDPVLLQGDFRKVSGISSEIFRQIEAVENDHDPSTAAALEVSDGERAGLPVERFFKRWAVAFLNFCLLKSKSCKKYLRKRNGHFHEGTLTLCDANIRFYVHFYPTRGTTLFDFYLRGRIDLSTEDETKIS